MDIWRYYDITHTLHTWCNPVSAEALEELEAVLDLQPGQRVLDIACGFGEVLLGFAKRHGVSGVGVDISPYAVRRAEARKARTAPDADVAFVEIGGADYRPDAPFDVVMCIGASWIWNGCEGTLTALKGLVRPGGLIVAGEPYWKQEPPEPYLTVAGLTADLFPTLAGYHDIALGQGTTLVWMRGVTVQDWDRYEMLQSASFDRFVRAHPDDPDLEEIRAKFLPLRDAYLRWGRDCLGFAFWVLRAPE